MIILTTSFGAEALPSRSFAPAGALSAGFGWTAARRIRLHGYPRKIVAIDLLAGHTHLGRLDVDVPND